MLEIWLFHHDWKMSYCVLRITSVKILPWNYSRIDSLFKNQSSNPNKFVDYFPVMNDFLLIENKINDQINDQMMKNKWSNHQINDLLSFKFSINSFHFIDQSNGWPLNNGTLDFLLFYLDGLHSVKKDNLELGFFFNWDSFHARLSSHCKAWSYTKKKQNEMTTYRKSV